MECDRPRAQRSDVRWCRPGVCGIMSPKSRDRPTSRRDKGPGRHAVDGRYESTPPRFVGVLKKLSAWRTCAEHLGTSMHRIDRHIGDVGPLTARRDARCFQAEYAGNAFCLANRRRNSGCASDRPRCSGADKRAAARSSCEGTVSAHRCKAP